MRYGEKRPADQQPLADKVSPAVRTIAPRVRPGSSSDGSGTFSGARVNGTGTVNVLTGAATIISWDTEEYDTSNYHNPASNPSRLTIPASGYYRVFGMVKYSTHSTGGRFLDILKNGAGTPLAAHGAMAAPTTDSTKVACSADVHLVAGDYIEAQAYQVSGTTLTVDRTQSFLGITLIALD